MDQTFCLDSTLPPPEGFRPLREAATMFLKVFPNRIVRLGQAPWDPSSYTSTAGSFIMGEIPVYGWNACSRSFEEVITSNMYFLTENLPRAEHCVWPTAPNGTYTDLAVKIVEFDAFLQKEKERDKTYSYPLVLGPGTFDDD